jgi:hypothetical protein
MFILKLQKELGDRLRDLVSELHKGDWNFRVDGPSRNGAGCAAACSQ